MAKTVLPSGVLYSVSLCLLGCLAGCRGVDPGSFQIEPQPADSQAAAAETEDGSVEATEVGPAHAERGSTQEPTADAAPLGQRAQEAGAEPAEQVSLTLRFAPGHTVTYRVTTEVQKSVQWQGAPGTKPAAFKGGSTGNRIEMTFEQQAESVDAEGKAVVRITIETLKYLGRVRNDVVLDFDSGRGEDQESPLANLVGKSYKLEMSPRGRVLALIDVEPLRQAMEGASPAHDTARKLLSREQILERHEVTALSAREDATAYPGQDWSTVKTFSFGMMGAKSFEKIYTLTEVREEDGALAVVEMQAIPSAAMAEEMHKSQTVNPFSKMFDNTESYEGRLELELDTGTIRRCVEEMRTEWVVADPEAVNGAAEPSALRMAASQLYRLEKVE